VYFFRISSNDAHRTRLQNVSNETKFDGRHVQLTYEFHVK